MNELIAHLFGDYVLQNHWMANKKTNSDLAAWCHVLCYMIPFLFLTNKFLPLFVIVITHLYIDRFRLARYWVELYGVGRKGLLFDTDIPNPPDYLSVWLLIIVDNTFHLTINHLALGYLQ